MVKNISDQMLRRNNALDLDTSLRLPPLAGVAISRDVFIPAQRYGLGEEADKDATLNPPKRAKKSAITTNLTELSRLGATPKDVIIEHEAHKVRHLFP